MAMFEKSISTISTTPTNKGQHIAVYGR